MFLRDNATLNRPINLFNKNNNNNNNSHTLLNVSHLGNEVPGSKKIIIIKLMVRRHRSSRVNKIAFLYDDGC